MVDLDEFLILDTGIVLHMLRDDDLSRQVEADYDLTARTEPSGISVVSVGEILAFARRNRYGPAKIARLDELIKRLVVIEVDKEIAQGFAEILVVQQAIGRPIGENDVWIAATAMVAEATLLTTDRDFARLAPGMVKVEVIKEAKP